MNLENELEHEQEYIVNRLQKQLSAVTAEKAQLEAKLNDEHRGLFDTLDASLVKLKGMGDTGKEMHVPMDSMAKEISQLRQQQEEFDTERKKFKEKNSMLREDLNKRKSENHRLQQKIMREHHKCKEMTDAKVNLEKTREIDLERLYNLASSSRAHPRASSPILSFVRDRSRTSSTYTSDCEGDDHSVSEFNPYGPSASPGNRSRTSSRASSGQKPRPLLVGRTPSPTMLQARGRNNSGDGPSPKGNNRSPKEQPGLKERPPQPPQIPE